ncbi:MAG TPA: hypothetical protein VK087_03135 [Tissierellaceae bacterium]|nr:hypothetical protein [Tissierellaceae bacterium]
MIQINKKNSYIIICSIISAGLTWFINHEIGFGAVIANGLIGVVAVALLPNDLAGIAYTSSFVGMSSLEIIPSLTVAVLVGLVVSLVLIATVEVYAGIGGKGGTTVALSTIITKAITSLFG